MLWHLQSGLHVLFEPHLTKLSVHMFINRQRRYWNLFPVWLLGPSVRMLTVVAVGNFIWIISLTFEVNAATAFLSWSWQSDTITLDKTVSRCQTVTVYTNTCRSRKWADCDDCLLDFCVINVPPYYTKNECKQVRHTDCTDKLSRRRRGKELLAANAAMTCVADGDHWIIQYTSACSWPASHQPLNEQLSTVQT